MIYIQKGSGSRKTEHGFNHDLIVISNILDTNILHNNNINNILNRLFDQKILNNHVGKIKQKGQYENKRFKLIKLYFLKGKCYIF